MIYLPRTEGISSTMIRDAVDKIFNIGIIGSGRIAERFVLESKYVSRVNVLSVFNPRLEEAVLFKSKFSLMSAHDSLEDFFREIDAVYIASPHLTHYSYIKSALLSGKHVLCEIPFCLEEKQADELYTLAKSRNLVLLEASKTAFAPAFLHLVRVVKSGVIGEVVDVQASLSKLASRNLREFDKNCAGGSMTELSPLPLMAIIKLLGLNILDMKFFSRIEDNVDVFTKGVFVYQRAIASMTIGLGVKTEGNLVISGTKGYVYVPAPWWKTEYFELRFEDQNLNRKFYYPFQEEGLRYELWEFINMISNNQLESYKMKPVESIAICTIIEQYRSGKSLINLN